MIVRIITRRYYFGASFGRIIDPVERMAVSDSLRRRISGIAPWIVRLAAYYRPLFAVTRQHLNIDTD
jgi:hypothetical protein